MGLPTIICSAETLCNSCESEVLSGDISSRDVVTQGIPWNFTDEKDKIFQEIKFGWLCTKSFTTLHWTRCSFGSEQDVKPLKIF